MTQAEWIEEIAYLRALLANGSHKYVPASAVPSYFRTQAFNARRHAGDAAAFALRSVAGLIEAREPGAARIVFANTFGE